MKQPGQPLEVIGAYTYPPPVGEGSAISSVELLPPGSDSNDLTVAGVDAGYLALYTTAAVDAIRRKLRHLVDDL